MKVTPYWSWTPAGVGLVRLKNQLSGAETTTSKAILDLLNDLYVGEPPNYRSAALEQVRNLAIVFDDEAEEGRWLDVWERSAFSSVPQVDQIELTNRCAYRCGYCPRTHSMSRPLGAMSLPMVNRLLSQIPSEQGLIGLHNFGESAVHPQITEVVAATCAHGLRPGLSINPPSLSPAKAQALVDAGLALLVFSLDSLNSDRYRTLRGPAARMDRALTAIEAAVMARDGNGGNPKIVLQMIDLYANGDEQDAFLTFCRDMDVDRGVVVRFGVWDTSVAAIASHGAFTSPGYLPFCRRPWESLVVLWDGRVTPCCHDYDGEVVLGDAATDSVAAIWNGAAAWRFRDHNEAFDLCRRCMFGRWGRDALRRSRGFRSFHRDVNSESRRLEWIRPGTDAAWSAFDFFDVKTIASEGGV